MRDMLPDFGLPGARPGPTNLGAWVDIEALDPRAIPPFPGASIVEPAKVPDPPAIDSRIPDADCAAPCLLAWRGAASACWPGSGRRLHLGGRSGDPVAYAGATLRDLGVPPMAWVLDSFDCWRLVRADASAPPTVAWTFSAKRLERRARAVEADWRLGRWRGGRVVVGDLQRQFAMQWLAMRDAILARPPRDRASLLAMVDEHFQRGQYERMVDAARAESRAVGRRLASLAEAGECFWAE